VLGSLILIAALALPQKAPDSSLWRSSDTRLVVATVVATGVIVAFDEQIAQWARGPAVQGSEGRHDAVKAVTTINEWPLSVLAITTYAVGKIGRWPVVADVGAHLTESLAATIVASEIVRVGLGRARPYVSPDDQFHFKPGAGFSSFDYRSFPSIHAAVAFATAGALAEELRLRDIGSRRILTPLLFAAAALPGFTRVYLDQHWASDVLVGSVLGAWLGTKVVRYTHGRQTKLDGILLSLKAGVNDHGASIIGVTLVRR
jgi:membrane-associated phospholipid phosphatase